MTNQTAPPPARTAKEQFDRQAAHYDAQWNSWNHESLVWLLSRARPTAENSLLDIATGAGFTALAFAPHVKMVTATDVSSGMLDQGRRKAQEQGIGNIEFLEAPAEKLPFHAGEFDIATCRVAAHHFLDIHAFVGEAARVLRPGGRLLIADTTVPDDDKLAADWQNEVEVIRDPSHVRNYSPAELKRMVEQAGLTVDEIVSSGGGITIPLIDWMRKSGCTPEQENQVREIFDSATPTAREQFQIRTNEAGETVFTWQRVLLRAIKPANAPNRLA